MRGVETERGGRGHVRGKTAGHWYISYDTGKMRILIRNCNQHMTELHYFVTTVGHRPLSLPWCVYAKFNSFTLKTLGVLRPEPFKTAAETYELRCVWTRVVKAGKTSCVYEVCLRCV